LKIPEEQLEYSRISIADANAQGIGWNLSLPGKGWSLPGIFPPSNVMIRH
jgi:hypothetical protein